MVKVIYQKYGRITGNYLSNYIWKIHWFLSILRLQCCQLGIGQSCYNWVAGDYTPMMLWCWSIWWNSMVRKNILDTARGEYGETLCSHGTAGEEFIHILILSTEIVWLCMTQLCSELDWDNMWWGEFISFHFQSSFFLNWEWNIF